MGVACSFIRLYDPFVAQPDQSGPPPWGWYLAWAAVGAGAALSLLGALTIGVFVAPFVALGGLALVSHARARPAAPALVCGLAVPPLWVAYLNRDGPGTICTTTAASQACVEEWSPWPWLAVALALLAGGVAVSVALRRAARR